MTAMPQVAAISIIPPGMQLNLLTIVGVGLIGGSIGLAAKRRGLARRVRGLGHRQASLERALALGAIDEAHLDPKAAMADADFVVFCTPVDQIAAQVLEYSAYCKRDALLTDAGSAKAALVKRIDKQMPAGRPPFVGSHPLAGSEKRGPEFADAQLFEGRWTLVTPTAKTPAAAVAKVTSFWTALGSRVQAMHPFDHDGVVGVTSHLPHVVAAALAGVLPADSREFAASGFRDTTRIASGDPALWAAILFENRAPVLSAMAKFSGKMCQFRLALEAHDHAAVASLLAQAKEVRDAPMSDSMRLSKNS